MAEDRIAALLDAMTIEEQIALLAGRDSWTTTPVDRLGIPSIKVSDGPNGARGGGALVGGVKAAAFPVGIALAATWDTGLVEEVGAALAREAKSKDARVLLGPTANMQRSTLNGRNFECYSEDPFLAAELAVAHIVGLQSQGVGATVKHFIGNESEYQRTTMSSDVDERSLREIYMPPFEAAVKRAKTLALMTSYNRLDGRYVSERADIINGVLKREWGFDGVVMSDWSATKSTAEALNAGLDLEMPGPPRYRGEKLVEAYRVGLVPATTIRDAALRVLRLVERVGAFKNPAIAEERAEDLPETRALIRRAGAEAMVLLKNADALPLALRPGTKIAVLGPNAKVAQAMGGGSAQLNPHYLVTPWGGLTSAAPEVEFLYAQGADNRRLVAPMAREIVADFYAGRSQTSAPARRLTTHDGFFMFIGDEGPGVDLGDFRAEARSRQTLAETGDYEFSLVSSGPAQLFVDDELVVDGSDFKFGEEWFGTASNEIRGARRLEAGRTYVMRIEWRSPDRREGLTLLRVGMGLVIGEAAIERAVETARGTEAALVFVGLNGEWDGEGMDRPNLDLPHRQNELVERVAAVNPKTIVVLQSGGPVLMPWLDKVAAVVQAWYPGQEVGNAIADVILGKAEPGGRLPQTFPRRLEDDPTRVNYPGEAGRVLYGERIFIGYRYAEKVKIEPQFPFGFGLSYTRFQAGPLTLGSARLQSGETLTASLEIANVGDRAGSTVVQFYVADEQASVLRPPKELKAFAKLHLNPGESNTATVSLDMRALAFFDIVRKAWVAEAGVFRLLAGFSSSDIVADARFELMHTWMDDSPARACLT
ncbi:MAG TPA: glycoside hydrolase family 3 C-terminal domain-containing protein [Roseiarcus sp.]|nr:glycoside hydrolase family 3 C-terminal domain-containing protein [Roseiarcus sp.]